MNCFDEEIKKTIADINKNRESGDLCFAMLAGTHLSDQGEDTCRNLHAVDDETGFDFLVHLGNITNGNNPKKITGVLTELEIERYKNAIASKKLFLVQGAQDGWRDERYAGQLAQYIMTDDEWYRRTSYIDGYANVSRTGHKPYYFADINDVRLVFLCSNTYQIDEEAEVFEKYLRIDAEQQRWLIDDVLANAAGKTVIFFSDRIPRSRFEDGKDPYVFEGRFTEPVTAIIQKAMLGGVRFACWFAGGYGCDGEINICGENFAVIGSQLPKAGGNCPAEGVRFADDRHLGSVNQDLWDAVLVKKNEIKLFRFGSGQDRTIKF